MPHLITFQTDQFDPRAERENPMNPIAGEAVLNWLRGQIASNFEMSEPEPEDFGWCSSVQSGECVYIVVASADIDEAPPIEWAIQIDQRRSFIDKLRGRNQHDPADLLTVSIRQAIESDQGLDNVTVDLSTR